MNDVPFEVMAANDRDRLEYVRATEAVEAEIRRDMQRRGEWY